MPLQLRSNFFRYVAPGVASMWVYALYTMADGMFVARGVGPDALAAVNLSIPFNCFVLALGVLFAMGASTKMSISLGEGRPEEASRIFTQNIITVAAVGGALSLAAFLCPEFLARLLGAEGATLEYTVKYLRYISLFGVCSMVSYNLELQLKAEGAPVIAMLGTAAAGLANVGLDALFVLKYGWGVEGASLATGISQCVCMTFFLVYFVSKSKRIRFCPFRFSLGTLGDTLRLGVSGFVGELDASFTSLLYNRVILHVAGGKGLVAYTVVAYVQNLVANTMMGISQGACPLISYSFGARDVASERGYRRLAYRLLGASGAVATILTELFAPALASLYLSPGLPSFPVAVEALRLYAPVFLLLGFAIFFINDFMAVDRGGTAFRLSLLSLGFVCVAVVVMGYAMGAVGVWLSAFAAKALIVPVALLMKRKASITARQPRCKPDPELPCPECE